MKAGDAAAVLLGVASGMDSFGALLMFGIADGAEAAAAGAR